MVYIQKLLNNSNWKYFFSFRKISLDHGYIRNLIFLSQNTRKMNCPAKVIMRDVVFFTGFKVSNSTERSYIPTYTAF